MLPAKIFENDLEVDEKLAEFSVTRKELIEEVIKPTLNARDSCVPVDVASAKGYFSYQTGTRYLRWLFLKKGWEQYACKNVEGVRDPKTGRVIIFQNVIEAAGFKEPQPISKKGNGSASLVNSQQYTLFPEHELRRFVKIAPHKNGNKTYWYLCVSFHDNGNDEIIVRAELSLPSEIKNGNFRHFPERIFLLLGDTFGKLISDKGDESFEIEPSISRKL